jgi:quercetin dioxygenase-like cupin family protein
MDFDLDCSDIVAPLLPACADQRAIIFAPLALAAGAAFTADIEHQPFEGGSDPEVGSVRWRTLISGDRTPSQDLVLGVAEFGPYGTLKPHRHAAAEFYFALAGDGTVEIDGVAHRIAAGVAVFIPGDAEHGVTAGPGGLSFVYGFPEDSFGEVNYRFSATGNPTSPVPDRKS